MSTTRSQKRKTDQQRASECVSEGFVSPIVAEDPSLLDQQVSVAGPSKLKSPRIENSLLENLRTSLKEEITSEIKALLVESQREMLELIKPETKGNTKETIDEEIENEDRSFYTPTKTVRINSIQNNDSCGSRNTASALWSLRHHTV